MVSVWPSPGDMGGDLSMTHGLPKSNYMYADVVITFGANRPFGFPSQTKASKFYKQLIFTSENYKDFVNIRHTKSWKSNAQEFKKGKVCSLCGSESDLSVHHFDNHNYEEVTVKNCTVVCKACHYKIHNEDIS
jgi:hypothetical protein